MAKTKNLQPDDPRVQRVLKFLAVVTPRTPPVVECSDVAYPRIASRVYGYPVVYKMKEMGLIRLETVHGRRRLVHLTHEGHEAIVPDPAA